MATAQETLAIVSALLAILPGVAVKGAEIRDGCARIEISATGAAIDSLQPISLGANAPLDPWPHPPDAPPELPAAHSLVASTAQRDQIEFGDLQLLGIHLVWHLHSTGAIDAPRANAFLQAWHGAAVGA